MPVRPPETPWDPRNALETFSYSLRPKIVPDLKNAPETSRHLPEAAHRNSLKRPWDPSWVPLKWSWDPLKRSWNSWDYLTSPETVRDELKRFWVPLKYHWNPLKRLSDPLETFEILKRSVTHLKFPGTSWKALATIWDHLKHPQRLPEILLKFTETLLRALIPLGMPLRLPEAPLSPYNPLRTFWNPLGPSKTISPSGTHLDPLKYPQIPPEPLWSVPEVLLSPFGATETL